MCVHYNNLLKAIKMALEAVRRKGPAGVDAAMGQLEFKRYGFWLMINLMFFNGARPQVVCLMTNRDFTQRTTVSCPPPAPPSSSKGAKNTKAA